MSQKPQKSPQTHAACKGGCGVQVKKSDSLTGYCGACWNTERARVASLNREQAAKVREAARAAQDRTRQEAYDRTHPTCLGDCGTRVYIIDSKTGYCRTCLDRKRAEEAVARRDLSQVSPALSM